MTAPLLDFGARVVGQVLDEASWQHESRVRAARPHRHAVGEVCAIYPLAPEIAGIALGSGERVTVKVGGGCGCESCPHDVHEPGDCLVATVEAGVEAWCACGASMSEADRALVRGAADAAWEQTR